MFLLTRALFVWYRKQLESRIWLAHGQKRHTTSNPFSPGANGTDGMRIISGARKGRNLKALRGRALRPTSGLVKGSIFNVLGETVQNAEVLDLFAGTGNLGLEALSRGALSVVFVEDYVPAIRCIRQNVQALGFESSAAIRRGDTLRWLQRFKPEQFDMVFADPPYRQAAGLKVLQVLARRNIIRPGGTLVFEHHRREPLPLRLGELAQVKEKKLGDTLVTFYRREHR